MKNIDETRNYLIEEIKWNELMSKKHKKILQLLSYIENFLILGSTITGCASISTFAFLVSNRNYEFCNWIKKQKMEECFYQNVQCVMVKNWISLERKKLVDY